MGTYIVQRLEQAKLLTDPFKLKLIEQFARSPVTTKQVADRMGEKAPRLYRHVDALVEEGLLELVEEKPKRGTVERYYRTVADRFEIDPDLFSTQGDGDDSPADLIRSLFRDTESELVGFFEAHKEGEIPEDDMPMVVCVGVRGTPDDIKAMRAKLQAWLDDYIELCGDRDNAEGLETWSALLAFYPRKDKK